MIKRRQATLRFSSPDDEASFLCKLDKGSFRPIKSPRVYNNLKHGKHRFAVEALSVVRSLDPTPAVRTFRITFRPHRHHHHG